MISLTPSTSNGFTEITGYEVWRYNATDPDIKYLVLSFSNFYVDTSSISSGTTYKYVVRSVNKYGESSFSSPIDVLAAQRPDMMV